MKKVSCLFFCLFAIYTPFFAQNSVKIAYNQAFVEYSIDSAQAFSIALPMTQKDVYIVYVQQRGIDVRLLLKSPTQQIVKDVDSPNGAWGMETFEHKAEGNGIYTLSCERLDEKENPHKGKIKVKIRQLSSKDLIERERIKKELAPENQKTMLTADIDHFWEAIDHLKKCKTRLDSIQSFQHFYLDRATDGLVDFIRVRDLEAEEYLSVFNEYPKFFQSVRQNTLEVKKAEPYINEIFEKFKAIYPDFQPFKVCFAISPVRTGGTISDKFVLIGTEISASSDKVDLSEFEENPFKQVLGIKQDVVQKIKNIVAHECVHTQQKNKVDTTAIDCPLLYQCMQEGFCDFIGELLSGSHINLIPQAYGDAHEAELWATFKANLCSNKNNDWLYNYFNQKSDKPADLGYYIGYQIAKAYYHQATDKKQAITDIIELKNPIQFLEKSGYDRQSKK